MTAEETVRRAMEVALEFGITRVADVTGLDDVGIPVVMVVRPAARSLSVSQGKGLTLADARASGLMESIELHHAEHITASVRISSANDLLASGDRVADPLVLSRLTTSRYTPEVALPWVLASTLSTGVDTWVPLELVDLDARLPHAYATGYFAGSSNGLASGNTRDEAIAHGLAEVIERDAEALWPLLSEAQQAATRIDLRSIDDPTCRQLLERLDAAGLATTVVDRTTDLGVASFCCAISDRDERSPHSVGPVSGSGCHPDARLALARAITEAAQSRLTVIAGSRDDLSRDHAYEAAASADAIRRFVEDAERGGTSAFSRVPTCASDVRDQTEYLLQALARNGLDEPLVVDLSNCRLGERCPAAVVKVIVPGLEGALHRPSIAGPRARRAHRALERVAAA